ncbi:MAG: hypothetical protein HY822_14885 [Acidobacteria bacterium]|nr:hypothetical protein [Acidobacteriota bacterium]
MGGYSHPVLLDGKPYSYRRNAPYLLGGQEWWDPKQLAAAYDMRGPRFTETCSILEVPFVVEK